MRLSLRSAAAVAAVAAALLTAGCSSSPTASPSTTAAGGSSPSASTPSASAQTPAAQVACVSSGSGSDAVKVVSGSGKAAPKVTFPVPTSVTKTERTVVKQGDGDTVRQGATVSLAYAIYDAKNGQQVDSRGFGSTNPVTFTADPAQLLPGLVQSLLCAKEGERFAAVIPASQAFGAQGSEQLKVGGGDSLVIVADLVQLVPTKATGAAKALPSGFPKVTLAASGQPTVAIPAADPPKKLRIATAKQGTGEAVRSGDTVTVQYQGVLWRNGTVFDQSWGKTGPTSFATTGVIKGFSDALVGAKVGSQVVAIIPPGDGYGSKGSPDGSIKGTDTLVFVVDVLATAHA